MLSQNNTNSAGNQVSKTPINKCSFIDPSLYMQTLTRANTNKCPVVGAVSSLRLQTGSSPDSTAACHYPQVSH